MGGIVDGLLLLFPVCCYVFLFGVKSQVGCSQLSTANKRCINVSSVTIVYISSLNKASFPSLLLPPGVDKTDMI